MPKFKRLILQKIDFAIDDFLYGNLSFSECIARIFIICYSYLEKKGVK